jgi:hypothetical protein
MSKIKSSLVAPVALVLALVISTTADAAEFSIVKEKSGDIVVNIDGKLFTRYVTTDKITNKCYFWPIIGPGQTKMTRAFPMQDVKGEKQDHPHHRSVCFGLQNAGGFNTWHERLTFTRNGKVDQKKMASTGRQVHSKVVKAEASGNSATLIVECNNVTPKGDIYMQQTRTVKFHVAKDGSRVMDIDIVLNGVKDIEVIGKKDSGLSVRVAHSMTVDAGQGGHIVNSNGDLDKKAWGKRAPWVDFNGPVEGKKMGIAMLNHPSSFRHPTPWHVRSYGLFTANPFALKEVAGEKESGNFTLSKGKSVTLKHRLIFHTGDEKSANIAEAWKTYAK